VNLLLFDVDGTLLDTSVDDDRLFREALVEGLPAGAQPVTIGPWHEFAEVTYPAIARAVITRACNRRAQDGEIMIVRRNVLRKWQQGVDSGAVVVKSKPGAHAIVAAARQRPRFTMAIATGGWGPTAIMKLGLAGFPVDELVIATADDSESRVGILRTAEMVAAAGRGVPGFEAIVVVGDGAWDARAAQQARAGFVGIASNAEAATQLRAAGAAAVISDFEPAERFWAAVDAALKQRAAAPGN
jgi:phosphoglycolate phosphatase-like HAD superfamily hydrolase